MSNPAAVMNDRIMSNPPGCAGHQIPAAAGAPAPAPPLPFSAPLLTGLANSVLIGNKPAAVQGSQGFNTPPHLGLHVSDPHAVPITQIGQVVMGSTSVLIENRGAAHMGAQTMICFSVPGKLMATATDVLIGG